MLNRELLEEFIKDAPNMVIKELMAKYDLPYHSCKYYLKKYKLTTTMQRIPLEKIGFILENPQMSNKKLERILDIAHTSIRNIRIKFNENIKKQTK